MRDSAGQTESYVDHVAQLERRLNTDDALRKAVGGEFVAIGKLEYYLLRSRGLKDHHRVVDVGCGSGRLACQLAPFPGLSYIGCDVVPRLLDYARELCRRPDWRFEVTRGATIPCADGVADFVCFFSVFTHLRQEEIFSYFREARRVLKPGGLMVMSFLEFEVPAHWATFIASVDGTRDDDHLNQFVDCGSLGLWAERSGFNVLGLYAGNTDYIPLPEEVAFENGAPMSGAGTLGQSVGILQKRDQRSTTAEVTAKAGAVDSRREPQANPVTALERPLPSSVPVAPLVNLSTRVQVLAGASVIVGFTIGGDTERRVLVRAVGPSLRLFGHPNPLSHPALTLYAGNTVVTDLASGWGGDAFPAAAALAVGAFTLPADNPDVAAVVVLTPGNYSLVVRSATPEDQGEVLVEVYLVD